MSILLVAPLASLSLCLSSSNFYSDYYKALMKLSPEGEADFELDFQLVELQFPLSSLLAATSI